MCIFPCAAAAARSPELIQMFTFPAPLTLGEGSVRSGEPGAEFTASGFLELLFPWVALGSGAHCSFDHPSLGHQERELPEVLRKEGSMLG